MNPYAKHNWAGFTVLFAVPTTVTFARDSQVQFAVYGSVCLPRRPSIPWTFCRAGPNQLCCGSPRQPAIFGGGCVISDRNQLCITKGITIITRYIRRQCQFGNNLKKARKRRKKGTRNRRSRRPPNRGTRTQPSRCADRPRGPAGAPGTQQSG